MDTADTTKSSRSFSDGRSEVIECPVDIDDYLVPPCVMPANADGKFDLLEIFEILKKLLDFWQSFGEAATRGRVKTAIFSMEYLITQMHIGRRHNNTTNCSERGPWQFSCGNSECRLCHSGALDLRGQIRSTGSGLLGWMFIVQEKFIWGHFSNFWSLL